MTLEEDLEHLTGEERPLQVAVDGPAGAGKSTIGRGLAQALACPYLDTGLMYRAVTREALTLGVSLSDRSALACVARKMTFSLEGPGGSLVVGEGVPEADLRTPGIEAAVSEVSAHQQVREALVERQRALAGGRCIVMIGRDIGTVVLPNAPVKLWITASPEERARRRSGGPMNPTNQDAHGTVLEAIEARDRKDAGRRVSPLRQAADAVVITTDELTPDEALRQAIQAIEQRSRERVFQR